MSLDALSTIREMDVANFRRVPRMPIYGTAQPSAKVPSLRPRVQTWGGGRKRRALTLMAPCPPQALGNILAYLSDAKRKLQQVVWINLREEVVLECDGHMHSLWPPGPALTPEQLEVRILDSAWSGWEPLQGEGGEPEHPVFLLYGWRS